MEDNFYCPYCGSSDTYDKYDECGNVITVCEFCGKEFKIEEV